jgi:hypothetical protein
MNLFTNLGFALTASRHAKKLMLLCCPRLSGTVSEHSVVFSVCVSYTHCFAFSLLIPVMLSMLTRPSKPSHLLKIPHFSMPSPPLKLFMVHGLPELTNSSIVRSRTHFTLQQTNSMSTTRRLRSLMPTFLRCVRDYFNLARFFC